MKTPTTARSASWRFGGSKGFPSKEFIPRRRPLNSKQNRGVFSDSPRPPPRLIFRVSHLNLIRDPNVDRRWRFSSRHEGFYRSACFASRALTRDEQRCIILKLRDARRSYGWLLHCHLIWHVRRRAQFRVVRELLGSVRLNSLCPRDDRAGNLSELYWRR